MQGSFAKLSPIPLSPYIWQKVECRDLSSVRRIVVAGTCCVAEADDSSMILCDKQDVGGLPNDAGFISRTQARRRRAIGARLMGDKLLTREQILEADDRPALPNLHDELPGRAKGRKEAGCA